MCKLEQTTSPELQNQDIPNKNPFMSRSGLEMKALTKGTEMQTDSKSAKTKQHLHGQIMINHEKKIFCFCF